MTLNHVSWSDKKVIADHHRYLTFLLGPIILRPVKLIKTVCSPGGCSNLELSVCVNSLNAMDNTTHLLKKNYLDGSNFLSFVPKICLPYTTSS